MIKVYFDDGKSPSSFFGTVLFKLDDYFTLEEQYTMGLGPNYVVIATDGGFMQGWERSATRPKLDKILNKFRKKYERFWLIRDDTKEYKFVQERDTIASTMETE